ncbi:MAG TPA: hypothetical protein VFB92_02085 [Vicinamibacterales bacterium]|jgi:hypothetical protein|nr:hypothetical protein [Vicinamibacterales bacterium]
MEPFFVWIEATSFSAWLRESPSLWVFPFILILHTVGLAFFVGANVAWDVRVLGFSLGIPLDALRRYFLVMWAGFWINAVSGVLLLIAYPTKALTNPLFYVKLTLIGFGIVLALRIRREVEGVRSESDAPRVARTLAAASLACWVAVIFAGRLLAYTCTRLTVDSSC